MKYRIILERAEYDPGLEEAYRAMKTFVVDLPIIKDDLTWRVIGGELVHDDVDKEVDEDPDPGQWIDIKNKLPDKSDYYLVYTGGNDDKAIVPCYFSEDYEQFGYIEEHYNPETLGYIDGEWIQADAVTHWMLLPDRPEEVNE